MAGKINKKEVPWYENYTESEFEEWFQQDPEGFKEYLSGRWQEWNEMQEAMKPGQPHPMAYEGGEENRQYAIDLNIFINQQAAERAQEAVLERHRPAPPRPPVDKDFLALSSRDEKDRKVGAEILRNRQFVNEQLDKAVEYRALGDVEKAREATARAGMMTREIQKTRKGYKYTFVEEADQRLVEDATRELEEATKLDPSTVEANREYYQGLVTAFNATHDGHFSYVIDGPSAYDQNRSGEPRIVKVEHGGLRACDVARDAENRSMSTLDHLINVGYGMTNPKAEVEETAEPEEEASPQAWEETLKPIEQNG